MNPAVPPIMLDEEWGVSQAGVRSTGTATPARASALSGIFCAITADPTRFAAMRALRNFHRRGVPVAAFYGKE